jgi:hypothetical protein
MAAREFAKQEQPVTIRQIFYHLVSTGMLDNTKKEYQRLVGFLVNARKAGFIPFEWIEDRSRRVLMVPLSPSITEYTKSQIDHYWKDTWEKQPCFIFILLEKEALSGIVWNVASYYNVPIYPTKGYSGWSTFANKIKALVDTYSDKKFVVLILGDYDPSGTDIPRDYIAKLEFFGIFPDVVERVALTKDQVIRHNLPPQMAKKDDPRYERYRQEHGEHSVELDALNPSVLREIVREPILKYLDFRVFQKDQGIEQEEKMRMKEVFERLFKEDD